MNLYIRYFDNEVVVTSVDEALDFIREIQGFTVTPEFECEFREYAEGNIPFPKKYKVRPRVYFIVIKTLAKTLQEFKANGKGSATEATEMATGADKYLCPKDPAQLRLNDVCPGWYEGNIHFKRVVINPATGKFDYKDTDFVATVKAYSAIDCYNRILDYLRSRDDIDSRSQFPSPKGKNYKFTYLGLKPYSELNV